MEGRNACIMWTALMPVWTSVLQAGLIAGRKGQWSKPPRRRYNLVSPLDPFRDATDQESDYVSKLREVQAARASGNFVRTQSLVFNLEFAHYPLWHSASCIDQVARQNFASKDSPRLGPKNVLKNARQVDFTAICHCSEQSSADWRPLQHWYMCSRNSTNYSTIPKIKGKWSRFVPIWWTRSERTCPDRICYCCICAVHDNSTAFNVNGIQQDHPQEWLSSKSCHFRITVVYERYKCRRGLSQGQIPNSSTITSKSRGFNFLLHRERRFREA